MLHPIMPFITEELWGLGAKRDGMLALAHWPEYGDELVNAGAEAEMRWTIALIEGVRSARSQMNVPASLHVPLVMETADDAARAALTANAAMIKKLARIGEVTEGAAPKGSLTVATPGATFALPLADLIDVEKEKDRIGKTLQKLGKEIGGLEGRLKNPKFAENAPPEVVAEAEENLRLRREEQDQLQTALDRLNEI